MILLYNPKSSAARKPVLPMSLLALGAALEGRFDYRILDKNLGDDLRRATTAAPPALIAMTVMPGPQLEDAVRESRWLREHHPHVPIVWGGYFPTQHHDVCLRSGLVDFVLRGHADHTFPRLAGALASGGGDITTMSIPGLVHDDDAEARDIPDVPDPETLRDFPYHRVPVERYVRATFMGRRTLPHHSSYGCPFTCNFCAVVNLVAGRYRAQSAARTARVVTKLVSEYGVDAVELYDNNFFVSEERSVEFADRIAPLSLGWWGEGRVDTLLAFSSSSWERMRASGLRMVFLGAEAASEEVLARMNKGGTITAEKTLELARRMREHGVVPELSFVMGSPPEPEADAERTIAFVRRVKEVNPEAEIILYFYTPVPLEGDLYARARASGFAFPETLDEWITPAWMAFAQRRSLSMPWIAPALRRKVANFERVLNAYYPTATDRRMRGPLRHVLRAASALRYHAKLYRFPIELRALHRLVAYQRPETTGF